MDHLPASAREALDIMSNWGWLRCDPDGNPFPPGEELRAVVNRLAMDGIRRPHDAILTLLCNGRLIARGNYRWQKYQDFNHFQSHSDWECIKPRHWQQLEGAIEVAKQGDVSGDFIQTTLQLTKLGVKDCQAYEWEFGSNRFAYARVTDDLAPWDDEYLEEWFSAYSIEIWPADLKLVDWDEPETDLTTEPAMPISDGNKGGRPPAADWELAALEMAGRYYRGDLKPQTIADVARALTSWLADQDIHPSDSVVRQHAKRIFNVLKTWEDG